MEKYLFMPCASCKRQSVHELVEGEYRCISRNHAHPEEDQDSQNVEFAMFIQWFRMLALHEKMRVFTFAKDELKRDLNEIEKAEKTEEFKDYMERQFKD